MKIKTACFVLFFSLLFISYNSFRKSPPYNWDGLAYMAIILKIDNPNYTVEQIHSKTFEEIKKVVPLSKFELLSGQSKKHPHKFRKKIATDPIAFNEQLTRYKIKPLYNYFSYLFYKLGVSLPYSTVLPSIISFFLIGFLVFYWLVKSGYDTILSLLMSLILVSTSFVSNYLMLSTPDMLSSVFIIIASYLILKSENIFLITLFLVLAILTRLDNILFSGIILLLILKKNYNNKVSIIYSLLPILVVVIVYLSINYLTKNPGYKVVFYHSFVQYLEYPATMAKDVSITFEDYKKVFINGFKNNIFYRSKISVVLIVFLSSALLKRLKFSFDRNNKNHLLFILVFALLILRFFLFPTVTSRFNFPYYIILLILLIAEVKNLIVKMKKH